MLRRVRRLPTTVVSFGMQKERLLRLHRFGPSSSRSKDYDDDTMTMTMTMTMIALSSSSSSSSHVDPTTLRGVAKADEKNDDDDDDDSWCIVAGHNASSSSKSSKSSSSSSQPSLLKSSFKKCILLYVTTFVRCFLPRDNVKNATTLSIITNTYSHYIQGETPTLHVQQSYGLKDKRQNLSIRVSSHLLKKKKKFPTTTKKKREIFKLSSSKSRKVFVVFVTRRDIIIENNPEEEEEDEDENEGVTTGLFLSLSLTFSLFLSSLVVRATTTTTTTTTTKKKKVGGVFKKMSSSRYDRQLRLWGERGQQALQNASVLVMDSGPTSAECAKNLILGGVARLTMCDAPERLVEERDAGNNFMVVKNALSRCGGKNNNNTITEETVEKKKREARWCANTCACSSRTWR